MRYPSMRGRIKETKSTRWPDEKKRNGNKRLSRIERTGSFRSEIYEMKHFL
jgi:hypothetical protein